MSDRPRGGLSVSYVIGRREIEPRASTSDLPRELDALQQRIGQGPCLESVWEQEVLRVDDVGTDDRWPEFGRQAAELGVGSMMCFRLFVEGDRRGGLNLYARTPEAFDVAREVTDTGAVPGADRRD